MADAGDGPIGHDVRWEDLPLNEAREELTAAWGDAEFVDARLRAWAQEHAEDFR